MGYVVTLEGLTPSARYDSQPWTLADIYEASAPDQPFSQIDSKVLDPVDVDPKRPTTRQFTTTNAEFQSGFYRVAFRDAVGGLEWTDVIGASNALITRDEYREAVGTDPTDTRNDAQVERLIPWATLAIQRYAERDFGAPAVTETRSYAYDGSGYLDIDDASEVTSLELVVPGGTNLTLDEWYAAPARRADAPVFNYIVIPRGALGSNPYMGFERNLDRLYEEGRLPTTYSTVNVTGTFGWPDVPGDVKLAAIWTIQDWMSRPAGEGLTAEAIEGYSRAWGARSGTGPSPSLAIPNKARDILVNYMKEHV